jgi:hypothetical protein
MANALKFHAVVTGKTLPLPDLSAFDGKRVEVIVMEQEGHTVGVGATTNAPRPLGLLRGQIGIADDFDAPLPPEIQKYFEGEDEDDLE